MQRWAFGVLAVCLVGCEAGSSGNSEDSSADAALLDAASIDATIDAALLDAAALEEDAGPEDAALEEDAALDDAALEEDAGPEDGAIEEDAGPEDAALEEDAGPEDAGSDDSEQCAQWRQLYDEELLSALNRHLHDHYEPFDPVPNASGNLDRYYAAREWMYQLSFVTDPENEDLGGAYCIYTGEFHHYAYDEEPDSENMNCEHVWPRANMDQNRQSALYKNQQADLLMLRPVGSGVNSCRGSFPFADVEEVLKDQYAPALYGKSSSGLQVFEPGDFSKGDVARIMFYFATRWALAIPEYEETPLRAWADLDPVDDDERMYNDAVEEVQGNRNPFIDCPGLEKNISDFVTFQGASTNNNMPIP